MKRAQRRSGVGRHLWCGAGSREGRWSREVWGMNICGRGRVCVAVLSRVVAVASVWGVSLWCQRGVRASRRSLLGRRYESCVEAGKGCRCCRCRLCDKCQAGTKSDWSRARSAERLGAGLGCGCGTIRSRARVEAKKGSSVSNPRRASMVAGGESILIFLLGPPPWDKESSDTEELSALAGRIGTSRSGCVQVAQSSQHGCCWTVP